ncbi:MAG: hypothetical protein K9M02_18220 [Thiohalocapsa sp.]|nr:hypothetical protein [Thiohalocapsa sp.]
MSSDYYGYPGPMQQMPAQGGAGAGQQGAYAGAAHPTYGSYYYGAYYPGTAAMGQQMLPAYPPARTSQSFFNLGNDRFVKGLLIGAAAAYLLTNEDVQRTAIKGAVKLWSTLQGGIEEAKERFRDAEAELQASESGK